MNDQRLFLLDGHALCYRAFYAIRNLTNSKGQATNAIFGFLNIFRKLLKEYQPTHMAVCFDSKAKTLREEKFDRYKIQRAPMPDDLCAQIPIIKEIVKAYRIPCFELDGYEADDIIATLAVEFNKTMGVVIVSDDKDMYQLVNGTIKMYSSRKEAIVGVEEVIERFGIKPEQIPDYIGLAGDNVDNIPGVNGVGEVTARKLLEEFGSVEGILANLDQIKSAKLKEKLEVQKDMAVFSKQLAILDTKVPVHFELDHLKIQEPDCALLFDLFNQLEFRRLSEEMAQNMAVRAPEVKVDVEPLQEPEEIAALIEIVKKVGHCVFLPDVSEQLESNMFINIVIAVNSKAYSINSQNFPYLREVFADKKVLKITYNAKEIRKTFGSLGIDIQGQVFDCLLAGYLLSPVQSTFDIKSLAWTYCNRNVSANCQMGDQVIALLDLYPCLVKELKDKSLLKLFEEIEMPLSDVLFEMESSGVRIDLGLLTKMSNDYDLRIRDLAGELYKDAGIEFNINSPKQLSHVLFERLGLKAVKKTKTGFSTDEEVLVKLAELHPLPAKILDYRQLSKLKSTYIDALPKLADPKTHRIHASFNQTGAETGRLSSNNPNLQNIPIRTEAGRQIRAAFIPHDAKSVLVSADYSQIELRILAHLSQDARLMEAFHSDEDIHTYTAALMFDLKENEVQPEMRYAAKRVNFGIIYGMSAFGLSKDLKISAGEAQDFIERYFMRYPKVKDFMDQEIAKAEELGYVVTLLNRRRYIPEIKSKNMGIRQFAQRQAINTPVQGSAADLMKLAMINIADKFRASNIESKMIITVHDEIVFNVPQHELELVAKLIRTTMEESLPLSVPIKASIKYGPNWRDMKEMKGDKVVKSQGHKIPKLLV